MNARLVAMVVLVLAAFGTVACGARSSPPGGAAATSAVATAVATAKNSPAPPVGAKPNSLIYASQFEPTILNGLAIEQVARWAQDIVFDGLVRANTKLELVPRLAASWDISDDGKTYTFKLQPNAKWHDGQPVTSDDVAFTYQAVQNPPPGVALLARTDYAGIDRIETPDPQTVRFVLKNVDASFLTKLQGGILPKHILEGKTDWSEFNRRPVGTGAYKLEKWDSGQQLIFAANPDYWMGKPAVETVIWRVVKDANALFTQLQNGEVDGSGVPIQNIPTVKQNAKLKVYDTLGAATYIGFQFDNPLFKDVRVRQALAYGLDKGAVISQILKGQGRPATSLIQPSSWAYNPNVMTYPFDPAKAKQLLAEAGWKPGSDGILAKDGKPFKFVILTNSELAERKDITVLARQQWRDLGVDVEPQYLDNATFINDRVLKANFDAILLAGTVNLDPDYLRRNHASASIQAGSNFLHWSDPQLDALLAQGIRTPRQADRKPIYDQAQQIIAEQAPAIYLYHPFATYAFRPDLQGVDPSDVSLFWNIEKWRY